MTRPLLLAAGVLIEICLLVTALLGDLGRCIPLFLCLYGLAFLSYLWAVRHADGFSVRAVVAFGLLFRLTLLPTQPSLSDDVYRYVWDGRVQAAGINPYRYTPNAPELAHLRDDLVHPRINHPHIPTIYPPVAQFLFLACDRVSSSAQGFKVAFVLIDLLAAWFVWGLLRRLGLSPGRLLVYVWNPLLVIETAGSGHVEVLGVALLAGGLAAVASRRRAWAVSALAGACLAKLMPAAILPAWWVWASKGTTPMGRGIAGMACRALWPAALFAGLVLAASAPYSGAGATAFAGLGTYARQWEFNGLVYGALTWVGTPGLVGRWVCAGLLATVALGAAFGRLGPLRAGFVVVGAFLWLTPTFHPWYALWLLPFLTVYRSWPWLALTGLVVLSYTVLSDYTLSDVWREAWWVRPTEAGGFALVWAWTRMRSSKFTEPDAGD